MNIKAILTTLILGSSTVAVADPIIRDQRTYPPPYPTTTYEQYNDNHIDQGRHRFMRPVLLADNIVLSSARAQRPNYVAVDVRARGLNQLRFDVGNGRAILDSVVVLFADGHRQTFPLNRVLTPRQPSVTIDLPHGGITGMYIYGSQMQGRRMGWGYGYGYGHGPTPTATLDVIALRR